MDSRTSSWKCFETQRDRSNPRGSKEGTGEGEDRTAGLSANMVLLRGRWKSSGIMVTFSELRSGR